MSTTTINGYTITRVRVCDRVRWSLFGPAEDYGRYRVHLKVRYARGEPIPQRTPLIGCFDSFEDARDAIPHLPDQRELL